MRQDFNLNGTALGTVACEPTVVTLLTLWRLWRAANGGRRPVVVNVNNTVVCPNNHRPEATAHTGTIGRADDNTVVVPQDPYLSRYHLEVRAEGRHYAIRDLATTNGTFLNGRPIPVLDWIPVGPGARVVMGQTTWTVGAPQRTLPTRQTPKIQRRALPSGQRALTHGRW